MQGEDTWRDDTLAERVSAVLAAVASHLDVPDEVRRAAEAAAAERVMARLAQQATDLAAVGAPDLVRHPGDGAQRVGMLTFVEQFSRAHDVALAADGTEAKPTEAASAAWWLAHQWWTGQAAPDPAPTDAGSALVECALALAVPLDGLPVLLGDHLGGRDPVRVGELRATVDGLRWRMDGDQLLAVGQCGHPAVEVALRQYLAGLTQGLIALARWLPGLPLVIEADLRAAEIDGRPCYLEAGARFTLAEDRVRTLLMGEQLYGDAALAIRELYQNAVDATRHAAARLEYLRRTQPVDGYAGQVGFVQDVEDDREFIECRDNGIGMGMTEITTAFSQLGIRSADLPEFVAEMADFGSAVPPVELWTNSRFGIGALSYFMLADQVEVTTTRLNRDGSLGQTLHVSIDGPGTCFRITKSAGQATAGTTVRLWLRQAGSVSVIGALNKVLAVAPVDVTVEEPQHSSRAVWVADELPGDCVPDVERRVWWVPVVGKLLSDGLLSDTRLRFAYVDLSGATAPRLSVDRTKILDYDEAHVNDRLLASLPVLLDTARPDQLKSIAGTILESDAWDLADRLADVLAGRAEIGWKIDDYRTDVGRSGFVKASWWSPAYEMMAPWMASAACLGNPGLIGAVDQPPGWVRPRPSDIVLLDRPDHIFTTTGADRRTGLWPLVALGRAAASLRRHPAAVVERYAELGIRIPAWRADLPWDDSVARILDWCNSLPVPEAAVAAWASELGQDGAAVQQVLDAWQVPHEDLRLFAERAPIPIEKVFLNRCSSREKERTLPAACWRPRGDELRVDQLNDMAEALRWGLWKAAQMARQLGLRVPMPPVDVVDARHRVALPVETKWDALLCARSYNLTPSEMVTLANDLGAGIAPGGSVAAISTGGFNPPDDAGGPLSRAAVGLIHQATVTPLAELEEALEWAGFELVGPPLVDIDPVDLALAFDDQGDGDFSVWPIDKPLKPYWIMVQALQRQLSAHEALRRYQRLGYEVEAAESITEPTALTGLLVRTRGAASFDADRFFSPGDTVPAHRVLQVAQASRLGFDELLAEYRAIGLNPEDPRVALPVPRPGPIPPDR